MKVEIDPTTLAMMLAHRKIEKKYESLGWSPWEEVFEEYVGRRLTNEAKKDYDKHYKYFFDVIMSRAKVIKEKSKPKFTKEYSSL
tara:strand:+ start:2473 stop:2727 length:255 start_codon:yes stop_codon:yes gene_type:complete